MNYRFINNISTVLILTVQLTFAQSANDSDRDLVAIRKPQARTDEAVGVMTKGQLQNLTMNFGQITDTRLADPGNAPSDDYFNFRFPRKNYSGMVDDFSLVFAIEKNSKNGNNGNVIDGYTANNNEDWIAKDGSLGQTHYDGRGPHQMITWFDGTPYLAHSDLPATWPLNASGEAFWPGYFCRDSTGKNIEGVFASDRDVYGVFTDANNQQGDVIGLEVEQMAYSYGNPLAEDIQFYEFFVHNTSDDTISDAWLGHYHDPDCSDYGEETLLLPDPDFTNSEIPDIIIQRDIDGDIGGATVPNARGAVEDYTYGVVVLETPLNLGVTDFHYFLDPGPVDDHLLWPIISSRKNDPDIKPFINDYFHGSNSRIDDVSLIDQKLDLVYLAASGPFTLLPGETVKYTLAVICGQNDAEFMKNAFTAENIFKNGFAGPKPPPSPSLKCVAGDERVTLYWDNFPETQPDIITRELDFEGYKIYRSQDKGVTWGKEITDAFGENIGCVPLAQFDLANGITGLDSLNTAFNLGSDTGLRHTYTDTTVFNGIQYAYTITSYDHGVAGRPEKNSSAIQALESSRGTDSAENNFVLVTPESSPAATEPANYLVNHSSGKTKCQPIIKIIDPALLNVKADYEIRFSGTPVKQYEIRNSKQKVLASMAINQFDLPIINGFTVGFYCDLPEGGISSISDGLGKNIWASHSSDFSNLNSTGIWCAMATETPGKKASIDSRTSAYQIRFTEKGSFAFTFGKPETSRALVHVPFEVWDTSINRGIQVNCQIKENTADSVFQYGEALYLVNTPYQNPEPNEILQAQFPDDFPYIITFLSKIQNAVLPETGEVVNLVSFSPPQATDVFSLEILPTQFKDQVEAQDLTEVKIVPNPYIVTAEWETRANVRSVRFMYLPPQCDISIFTIAGTKIREIQHTNGTGDEAWDLTNNFGEDISFGVYIYMIEIDNIHKIGKFALIK